MNNYLVGAYAIGFVLLWGYAVLLIVESRTLARREAARQEETGQGVE